MFKPSLLLRRLLCLFSVLLLLGPLCVQAIGPAETDNTDDTLIHLLLVGRDASSDDISRSDSMILCSFHPESKQITLTSFLRDLYVPIPGQENNRINAAYAYGGMELLQQTIEENFDLTIDGCLDVDFSQFSQIIDVLGGVTLELRQDEADAINRRVEGNLTEGTHLLTGEQALAYSRIRNLDRDGDFSRTQRQRKLLTSLLDSYRNASLITILSVIMEALPMVSTNLENRQILALTGKLFPFLKDPVIISQRLPADGTYRCQRIRDMEVLVADMEELRRHLHRSFLPDSKTDSKTISE